MSVDEKVELNETCDSCGCFAEIGTIIGEGDDVMELVIEAAAEADARAKLAAYEALAKQVTAEAQVSSETDPGRQWRDPESLPAVHLHRREADFRNAGPLYLSCLITRQGCLPC